MCPFERIKKYNTTPEAALYKAVIMQMIIDASNVSRDPKACRNEKRAKAWLFTRNDDFCSVCTMAEIDPEVVVTFAKELIAMHSEKARIKNAAHAKLQSQKKAVLLKNRLARDLVWVRVIPQ